MPHHPGFGNGTAREPIITDATAVNASRVLESELFDYVIACAEGNDDSLRYACLIAWCAQQPGAIAEVGRVLAYAIGSGIGDYTSFKDVLSPDAKRLLSHCVMLLRKHSGFRFKGPTGMPGGNPSDDWDYPFWLGSRIGHLLI